ncbi:hypothetical protein ACFY4B_36805 [Kitasatospora sp. NPDC001261]|uniref:hypothetical protein n=1 Tax=Kitasatospora sp. NPDC001261 TaxID=3364012 RepID=UPI0036BE1D9C
MKSNTRRLGRSTALAAAVGTAVVFAAGPASAAGGYWSGQCDNGRACIALAKGGATPVWNLDGCGVHPIHDYYRLGQAHGNTFVVHYENLRTDTVFAWQTRGLDRDVLVTSVDVQC